MPQPEPRKPLSRSELERLTAQLASLHGWHHHHLLLADRLLDGYPFGFPTDVLVRGERAVFVFYTSRTRPPTDAQQRWIVELREVRAIEPLMIGPGEVPALVQALGGAADERSAA
jgi:hypothetical protein